MKKVLEWFATFHRWSANICRKLKTHVRRQKVYWILSGFLIVFAAVFFHDSYIVSIQSGQLGILWRRLGGGTVIDRVYGEGIHLILPFNKMYIYNVRTQQFRDTINALTVDGLNVRVGYSVRYFLPAETLPLLHQRVGPNYADVVIRAEMRSVVRTVFGQYKPEEIYTAQKAIQEKVSELAKIRLEARFIDLDDVPLESITLPARISQAIESKMAYQQLEGEYIYKLSIAEKEAERRRIESNGLKVYNDTVNRSLTPSVLSWYGIQATQELAKSPNAKTVVIGAGKSGLPIILGRD
jgi:regulator of protease activity HflC (stomatin/prohibitin superfamily)